MTPEKIILISIAIIAYGLFCAWLAHKPRLDVYIMKREKQWTYYEPKVGGKVDIDV